MKRATVFGIGDKYRTYEDEIKSQYEIVCLADNDKDKWGNGWFGQNIVGMEEMKSMDFDFVLVVPNNHKMDIIRSLLENGIPKEKILPYMPCGGRMWKNYHIRVEREGCYAQFDEIRFVCKTSDDFSVMDEIYLFNTYDFYAGEKDMIAIDIGMNVGLASLFFAHRENIRKVYSFEPFESTYRRAMENIALNDTKIKEKIVSQNVGLGDGDREFWADCDTDHSGGVSTLQPSDSATGVRVKIFDAGREVGEIIRGNSDCQMIMKIDTEGSEYDIFSSLERYDLLAKVSVFLIETHSCREEEIKATLKRNGFYYFDHIHFHDCGMVYGINRELLR